MARTHYKFKFLSAEERTHAFAMERAGWQADYVVETRSVAYNRPGVDEQLTFEEAVAVQAATEALRKAEAEMDPPQLKFFSQGMIMPLATINLKRNFCG